ncbi:MAG: SUMF1/EgtB/PvdO family nonheme iron enzyme [Kiritimatiellae bacterium]|nr:SUMF1/EgtB/PvdO family nonheme iron enzyme [Kiritimatiellia bacterium]
MIKFRKWFVLVGFVALVCTAFCDAPVVSNVRASQRSGATLVDIFYDVADGDGDRLEVSVVIKDGGVTVPSTHFSGSVGANMTPGSGKRIVWDAGADYKGKFSESMVVSITADDGNSDAPSGMVRIPGGTNSGNDPDYGTYSLTVNTFYMDATEVAKAQWDVVYSWAVVNGYSFDHAGLGKASSHPVHTVSWYDCVKWCNARSEKEGRSPCYTVSGSVYRAGQSSPTCNFSANGYRLPTNDEWEHAARGGLSGKRFPWGDTITHSQANYYSSSSYSYDISSMRGYHPSYDEGGCPYTSPAGAFAANGYGLYDMVGNVWEWCNDASGSSRFIRGGSWLYYAPYQRCGLEYWSYPDYANSGIGFRAACR